MAMKRIGLTALLGLLAWPAPEARAEMVVISEIMYHPRDGKPQYLEVYNNTLTPFDIAEWRLTGGVNYDFPPFSTNNPAASFLKPFERVVLTSADEAVARAAYNIPGSVRVFGPWSGNLNARQERVSLKDKNGVSVCTVAYEDRGHWPVAADGGGHSLVLKDPNRTVDDWRNWTASQRPGGTPGFEPATGAETPAANPEVNLTQGLVLVDYGDRWRYHDQGEDLGTAWREPEFDDRAWPEGPGLLGFETAPLPAPGIQTPLNQAGQITYYLRKLFVFDRDPQGVTLTIDQVLDDGAVYYLNTNELGRPRMPGGDITFNTVADLVSDAVEELNVIIADSTCLRRGTNLLAVEVHQVNTTSSDVVFGARLRASAPTDVGAVINEVLPGSMGTGFIEFYNPTDAPVNLQGYYLSDSAGNLTQYRVNNVLMLPARGFGSVGFAESGFRLTSPVTIYLTAPDGVKALNALSATMPLDGRSLGRLPAGSGTWFLFTAPTRNQPNSSLDAATWTLRLNEVHFTSTNTADWVEVHNPSASTLAADGLCVATDRTFTNKVALSGQVAAKGYASFGLRAPLYNGEVTLFLLDSANTVIDAHTWSRPLRGDALQAYPDGTGEWYATTNATRNAPNAPEHTTDVVINEIMYNPPSGQTDGEYIELFNRGGMAVDLSDWRFAEGIEFLFPTGTMIQPGGYLVVAANTARQRAVYGNVPMIGPFDGRLDRNGEVIRLVDPWGNLADEVDYRAGGDWPSLAHGGGSSLELLNPWMDNRLASAWRESDETTKAQMRPYSYAGAYQQLKTMGGPTDYKEIYFHLVNEGHVVLENVELLKQSAGTNLIVNGTRMSTNGYSASGWLCQGTHWASQVTGNQLHIIADGRGDNRANRVEIDVTGMNKGEACELKFNARWVSGTPRVIFSTWDHSIANSFLLEIPDKLGTPGALNSQALPAPAPQVDRILHNPPVPRSTDTVRITAEVHSFAPLASVQVFHRADNANANGAWAAKAMYDDGRNGGDEVAGDGIYTAQLTEHKASGRVVQFYVQARTEDGQVCLLPRAGAVRPAMYVVDDRTLPRDLRTARFVISAYDVGAINNGNTSAYGCRFPRLSNAYKNMTFISNEKDVFYNGELRNSGSPWTRGGLERGKFKLPPDRTFRSHAKFYYDNDPEAGRRYHNRLTRYWLYLLGHPTGENEFIRVVINSGGADIREDTEYVDNDFLDRNFANGSEGELYRIDDEWWFSDAWGQEYRDADWSYKATDNPGRYRTEWMKRTRENEDDFTALITFFKTVSGTYTQAGIERLIDPCATLKLFAVRGYIDDWDFISLARGKNGFFYRRPTDGLFQFFQWDSDLTFGDSSSPLYSGKARVGTYIAKPYNLRLFYCYIAELVENYTKDSARLNAWLQAEEAASSAYSVDAALYRNWFNSRNSVCRSRMGANYTMPFAITTNGGQSVTTVDDTLELGGSAPYGVFTVFAEGHPEARLLWTGLTTWTLAGLQLRSGENLLRLRAVDQWGRGSREASITVTKTGNALPVMRLRANPDSWRVPVQEALELDARDSFDPEGGLLNLAWAATPTPATIATNQYGRATTTFVRPGLYHFTALGTDAAGRRAEITREAAVYGPSGFSSFDAAPLEDFWTLENVVYLDNYPIGTWVSLDEVPGELTLQVLGDVARPPLAAGATHPFIWRPLPAGAEWSLHTHVRLDTKQFGSFLAGLMIEAVESGGTNRYAFGLEDGASLSVKRFGADGSNQVLGTFAGAGSQVTLRVRRSGDTIFCEQRIDEVWVPAQSFALATDAAIPQGGLFLATAQPQAVKVHFDYALLVDPSLVSDLQSNLRITELMYNPIGGDDYEYVELANIGTATLDLTGVKFTSGITFTFGPTTLTPGERIVVVKNLAAFKARYGTGGIRMAAGTYTGKLDNGGETIELVDANNRVILSFAYRDDGDWPGRADGLGSSLEIINPHGNYEDPNNWRSSTEYLGSPGKPGLGPLPSVVINEVLAHTDPPLEDAIELYNPAGQSVDVSGWFVSDSPDDYRKFRIPAGTVLASQAYHVFYQVQFDTNNPLVPFALGSARGDQVYLTSADAAGNPLHFIDHVSFDASENGVSFGRFPNGTGPLVPMSRLTLGTEVNPTDPPNLITVFRTGPGASNAYPRIGPIVLNRIMYNPPVGGDEFIELLNLAAAAVPLFDPLHPTNVWQLLKGVEYAFPRDTALPANAALLVVGIDPAVFRVKHDVTNTVPIFGPWLGTLDNAGESLELYRPDPPEPFGPDAGFVPDILVDKVRYNNQPPWPILADGQGAALKRVMPSAYGDDPANWTAELFEPGADADHDGMPDGWEVANGLNPNSDADAALDDDEDGLSNQEEYLSGTDPHNAWSCLQVASVDAVDGFAVIRFTAVADKSYTIQYCESLLNGAWLKLTDVPPESNTRLVEVTDSQAIGRATRYYRLVTPSEP